MEVLSRYDLCIGGTLNPSALTHSPTVIFVQFPAKTGALAKTK